MQPGIFNETIRAAKYRDRRAVNVHASVADGWRRGPTTIDLAINDRKVNALPVGIDISYELRSSKSDVVRGDHKLP